MRVEGSTWIVVDGPAIPIYDCSAEDFDGLEPQGATHIDVSAVPMLCTWVGDAWVEERITLPFIATPGMWVARTIP